MKRQSIRFYSLGKRLIINVFIFLITPLIIMAITMNILLSNAMAERICRQQYAVLKQCEVGLSSMLEDMVYLSLVLLSNDNVQALVDESAVVRTKFDLSHDIQTLLNTRSYIQSLCISKEDKLVFQFRDIVSKEDDRYFDDVKKLNGRVFWTPTYEIRNRILSKEPVRVVSVMREIRSLKNWKPLGIERLSVAEETLCSYYADLYADDGSMLFLMDKNGNVVSSPDKKLVGQNLIGEDYISKVLLNQDGFFNGKISNKSYWIFKFEISTNGWIMVQAIPDGVIRQQIGALNFYIVFSIFICIVFTVVFYFLQKRNVVSPIEKLSREMQRVRTGDFKLQLPAKSRDEIGELSESFESMVKKVDNLINHIYKIELAEKEARLKTLESQINPHFLFNTLDTLRWIVIENGDYDAAKLIGALADIFRQVLNEGKEMTTISEEIRQVENYMFIQSYRFGDRIRMETYIDKEVLSYRTLKLILQPLVENAIKHGLECKLGAGLIQLSVVREGDYIRMSVKDDGIGADEDKIREKMIAQEDNFAVFALKNIDRRVKLKFGQEYGLCFSSKRGIGTTVDVTIPVLRGEEHETFDRG
jgi:two-component system sensor histidine kinase YesM